ncbi:cell division protein PerM [Micromonospora sp. NBC_01813]|uniref:cell division protein PerM n=1 Tax=Micromonospora sp. NBC_01813 TaxID=2975988 RepID=UPI003FA3CDAB
MAAHPPQPRPRSADRGVPDSATRPPRGGQSRRGRAPLVVAAAVNTLWAVLVSYLPVAAVTWLIRLAEGESSVPGAAQVGLAAWLLGHGVPLETPTGPLGLPPLMLSALAAWRIYRAGVHTTRAIGGRRSGSPGQVLLVAIAVGIAYGGIGAAAAVATDATVTAVDPTRAALGTGVFGALAALLGAARTTGTLDRLSLRCPAPLRNGIRAGLVATLLVLAAGAAAAGLSVAIGGGDAADTIGVYRAGVAGQAGITVLSVAYAPNATVWAAAYLLGPGFALGADTAVRTSEVTLGSLPAVPLFAGLPNGPAGGLSAALLALPVLAAMTTGWVLNRRWQSADGTGQVGWIALLGAAAISGPIAGLLLGLAAAASGGPLGAGRLAEIGPVPWQVAAAAGAVVTVAAVVGAAAARSVAAPTVDRTG